MRINLAYGIIIALCLFLGFQSFKRYWQEKREYRFLKQFLNFIVQAKQFYLIHGRIDDALYEVLYEATGQVLVEGEKLYEVLVSNKEEVRKQYMKEQKNPFVKLFGALVCIEMEYGTEQSKHTFLECIKLLQQDIVIELWKKEKIQALFVGLNFLILMPGFFLKVIERWGVDNLAELSTYYHGTFGAWALIGIFLVISMTWCFVAQTRLFLQKTEKEEKEHIFVKKLEEQAFIKWMLRIWEVNCSFSYQKQKEKLQELKTHLTPEQFLLQRWGSAIVLGICSLILFSFFSWSAKSEALAGKEMWKTESVAEFGMLEETWFQGIVSVEEKYKGYKQIDDSILWQELYDYYNRTNPMPANIGVLQVKKNLENYQKGNAFFPKVFFFLFACLFGWQIPKWYLLYEALYRRCMIEYEMLHYETIVILLAEKEGIDELTILEWLEEGSNLYKDILLWCWLSYYGGAEEACLELRELEKGAEKGYALFTIADALLLSDTIGMKRAFEEMFTRRKNEQEQTKQENEREVQKYGTIAQLIAFFPLSFIIGVYLILPFLLESMVQLSGFLQQIHT